MKPQSGPGPLPIKREQRANRKQSVTEKEIEFVGLGRQQRALVKRTALTMRRPSIHVALCFLLSPVFVSLSFVNNWVWLLIRSDANERPETENGTVYSHDSGFEGENYPALPASPTTIPRLRVGSTSRRDKPRRQRTTSTSQNTIRPNEAIIRISNNRTIYTAGNRRCFGNIEKELF